MAASAVLAIKIVADATDAAKGLDQASGRTSKFGQGLQKMVGPAIAVAGGVALIGAKAVKSASDLQQAQGAVETVFGKSAQAVKDFSQTADTRMGLAAAAYQNYAALVGSALQNAGFSQAESVAEADKIMQRAADMAATFGGTTAEAVEAINAAVARGEFDPLEKYGVALNQTAINAELAKRGQDDLTGAALQNAKATVALEQIYGKTAKTQGQFARESDSAAGAQQVAAAQFENASAALGEALLPAVVKVTQALTKIATWISKNTTLALVIIGVLGSLAAAVLILNAAYRTYQATLVVVQAVQKATWLSALGPIALVVAAVAAVVAIVVLLWKRSETFRRVVRAVWAAIKTAATATGKAIKTAFTAALNFVRGLFQKLRAAWSTAVGAIKSAASNAAEWIRNKWRAMVAAVVSVVQNLKAKVSAVWSAIRTAIGTVVSKVADLVAKFRDVKVPGAIKSAVDAVATAVGKVVSAVQTLVDWLGKIKVPKIDWPSPPSWLPGVGKAAPVVPAPVGFTSPRLLGRGVGGFAAPGVPAGALAMGGSVTIINVSGAIDPEGTARAIRRVLQGHDRRVSGRPG